MKKKNFNIQNQEEEKKLIYNDSISINIINNNSESLDNEKYNFIPYKKNYYKIKKTLSYGKNEYLYIASSYFGTKYYLKKIFKFEKN